MQNYFRQSSLLFVLALSLFYASRVTSLDYVLLFNTPNQVNAYTCQSYSLAVALSMIDTTGRWQIKNQEDLRLLEGEIRNLIVRESRNDNSEILRKHWRRAIERLSFGEYTMKGKTFSTYPDFQEYLQKRVAIKSRVDTLEPFTLSPPTTLYMSSFTEIENDSYPEGHIVTIVGQDKSYGGVSNKNASLLIVNSADKQDICLTATGSAPMKEYGYVNWVDNYSVKVWALDHLMRINWLEKMN